MNNLTRLMLGLAASLSALPALADERVIVSPAVAAAHSVPEANALRTQIRASRPGAAAGPKVTGTSVYPGTPGANAFRAYPPSCAADPLPDNWQTSTPTYTSPVTLYARDNPPTTSYLETVNVTVWRIACSSSSAPTTYNPNGLKNAMTLVRFDRASSFDHTTNIFPTFPYVYASQGGSAVSLVRVASEPNTVVSDTGFDVPLIDSTTYVLENYPYSGYNYFKFSDAFDLVIDPNVGGTPVTISVPDYDPTPSSYPDAFALLPLDGYIAAQWIGGPRNEGLLVQVAEQPQADGTTVRQLIFDLEAKDTNNDPMWLVGNAAFPVGTTSLNVNVSYLGNNLSVNPWGTVKIELPHCNQLNMTFQPSAQLPAPIASFSGLSEYDRLFSANGMVCE
jgi:hypothetical protein